MLFLLYKFKDILLFAYSIVLFLWLQGTTTDLSAQKVAIEDLKRKLDYFVS